MPHVNTASKEITAKVVYYGPGLSGKTTNLEQIHDRLNPAHRGRLISLATEGDRTLLFDMMPVEGGTLGGYTLRYQFYTVPGQVYYNASRRQVLKSVDALVFVADSQPARREANVESMSNLYDNLAELGIDVRSVPLVLQFNKRDLPGALPTDILQHDLNPDAVPAFEAVAIRGVGVFKTLHEAMRLCEEQLRSEY